MAETVWYYARGEVERGPFTTVQIKALANAGKLRADDLVWKEGMENWTSAAEVTELFADRAAETKISPISGPSESTSVRNPLLERAQRTPTDSEKLITIGCRGCIYVGMLCVVLVQGCESLGNRRIAQLKGAAEGQGAASSSLSESSASRSPEVIRAQADLNAGAFGRGITLYGGVLFLLAGAAGLATFAVGSDRWLGIVLVAILCFCLLAGGFGEW
jgi:ribosomal protein L18